WLLFVDDDVNRDGHIAASSKHDRMGKRNDAIIDGLSGPQRRPVLVVRWITHIDLEIVGHDLKSAHQRLPLRMMPSQRATKSHTRSPISYALRGLHCSLGEKNSQDSVQRR